MLNLSGYQGLDEELLVDTSEGQRRYLLISPNGQHIKLAPGAYNLLKSVHEGHSFEELAQKFSRHGKRNLTSEEIKTIYGQVAQRVANIAKQDGRLNLPPGFWLRLKILPAGYVQPIARILSAAYRPLFAAPLFMFIIVTIGWMSLSSTEPKVDGLSMWIGYLLFVLSLAAHEFGHASACAYFGAKPNDIGFAFYLLYPAFYSDVTAAWRLSRWQRVVVDLGGTFFQFSFMGLCVLAYAQWQWPALWIAFNFALYGAVFSLNPIFRFDGYWMLADALGVTNLSKQPHILIRHLLDKIRGRPTKPLPWPRWLVVVLTVYTPLSIFVWAYYLWWIMPWISQRIIEFPQLTTRVAETITVTGFTNELLDPILDLLATLFMLVMIGFALWRLLKLPVVRLRSQLLIRRARQEAVRQQALDPSSQS